VTSVDVPSQIINTKTQSIKSRIVINWDIVRLLCEKHNQLDQRNNQL